MCDPKKDLENAGKSVSDGLTDLSDSLGVKKAADDLADSIGDAARDVGDTFSGIGNTGAQFINWGGGLITNPSKAVTDVFKGVGLKKQVDNLSMIDIDKISIGDLNPVSLAQGALSSAEDLTTDISAGLGLKQPVDDLYNFTDNAVHEVGDLLGDGAAALEETVSGVATDIANATGVTGLYNSVADGATNFVEWTGVKEYADDLADTAGDILNWGGEVVHHLDPTREDDTLWQNAADAAHSLDITSAGDGDTIYDDIGEGAHYLDPTRDDGTIYQNPAVQAAGEQLQDMATDVSDQLGLKQPIDDAWNSASNTAAQFDDWLNGILWKNKAEADKAAEARYKAELEAQKAKANYDSYLRRLDTLAKLREARLSRSRALSASFASGSGISSSNILGVLGSLGSQVANNQGKAATTNLFGNYMTGLNKQIADSTYKLNKINAASQSDTALFNDMLSKGAAVAGMLLA